jgi:oligosaccharyltransferase complex subunit beta
MLSPFYRLPLKPISQTANSTIYRAMFTCPDQHGIFAFKVNYKRPFFTNVEVKQEVTVRHFAHDEWPRSWRISGGWVWIAGVWVTVAGWIAFIAIWLWSEAPQTQAYGKKTQ